MGATTFALLRRRQVEQKNETEATSPVNGAEWYSTLTVAGVLEAVDSGELEQVDALRFERERDAPRKTLLAQLDSDS